MSENDITLKATKKDVEENKINAILSYFGIFIIIPLLSESAKKSKFAKFHMNQGLTLLLAGLVVSWIPFVNMIVGLILIVFWLIGLLGAVQGEMRKIPVLGDITLIK